MAKTTLTITSKNYGTWSMRGWLMCKMVELPFEEVILPLDDPATRAEVLLLSPSFLVPCLNHGGNKIWDTLAIGEYLAETFPKAGLLPSDKGARAKCRSVCGEMHSGFHNLRSALPMNLKARYPGFKAWTGARADVDRVTEIWKMCIKDSGGPYLFGKRPTMADAMYAPVCTRFQTYDVQVDAASKAYSKKILSWPIVGQWIEGALAEADEVQELDAEF